MECKKCSQEAYFEGLCRRCFCEGIEKRIRKELRTGKLIGKGDILIIRDELCEVVLKDILDKLPVTIQRKGAGKEILLWTLDDEIGLFLQQLFAGKAMEGLGHQPNKIKLFIKVRDEELERFAQAKGLPFKKKDRGELGRMMHALQEKYPEMKFSLAKSVEQLREMLAE